MSATSPVQHGVGMVDLIGVDCLCGSVFAFSNGGFTAFNEHLCAGQRDGAIDVERLAKGIAYAFARTPLTARAETSLEYARRLAPLVIESGWLGTQREPE